MLFCLFFSFLLSLFYMLDCVSVLYIVFFFSLVTILYVRLCFSAVYCEVHLNVKKVYFLHISMPDRLDRFSKETCSKMNEI